MPNEIIEPEQMVFDAIEIMKRVLDAANADEATREAAWRAMAEYLPLLMGGSDEP